MTLHARQGQRLSGHMQRKLTDNVDLTWLQQYCKEGRVSLFGHRLQTVSPKAKSPAQKGAQDSMMGLQMQ